MGAAKGRPSRSMEAFALMREELRRTREINADLLAACELVMATWSGPAEDDNAALAAVRTAIAKAEGRTP